jgi:hypothetical protein
LLLGKAAEQLCRLSKEKKSFALEERQLNAVAKGQFILSKVLAILSKVLATLSKVLVTLSKVPVKM